MIHVLDSVRARPCRAWRRRQARMRARAHARRRRDDVATNGSCCCWVDLLGDLDVIFIFALGFLGQRYAACLLPAAWIITHNGGAYFGGRRGTSLLLMCRRCNKNKNKNFQHLLYLSLLLESQTSTHSLWCFLPAHILYSFCIPLAHAH